MPQRFAISLNYRLCCLDKNYFQILAHIKQTLNTYTQKWAVYSNLKKLLHPCCGIHPVLSHIQVNNKSRTYSQYWSLAIYVVVSVFIIWLPQAMSNMDCCQLFPQATSTTECCQLLSQAMANRDCCQLLP